MNNRAQAMDCLAKIVNKETTSETRKSLMQKLRELTAPETHPFWFGLLVGVDRRTALKWFDQGMRPIRTHRALLTNFVQKYTEDTDDLNSSGMETLEQILTIRQNPLARLVVCSECPSNELIRELLADYVFEQLRSGVKLILVHPPGQLDWAEGIANLHSTGSKFPVRRIEADWNLQLFSVGVTYIFTQSEPDSTKGYVEGLVAMHIHAHTLMNEAARQNLCLRVFGEDKDELRRMTYRHSINELAKIPDVFQ